MRGSRGVSLVPSSTLPLMRKSSPPLALSLSNFISSWVPHFLHYTLTPLLFLVPCQSTIQQKSFSWRWEGCSANKRPATALANRPTFTKPENWQIILQVIHHTHNYLSNPSFRGALSSKLHTQKSSQRSHSVLSNQVQSWLGRNNVIPRENLGAYQDIYLYRKSPHSLQVSELPLAVPGSHSNIFSALVHRWMCNQGPSVLYHEAQPQ